MSTHIVSPELLLPLSAIKLGRLISSVKEPLQGFHDPSYKKKPGSYVTVRESFIGGTQTSSSRSFATTLTSLLSLGLSRTAQIDVQITADAVKTHPLENSEDWFEEATAQDATRLWMEKQVDRGSKMYMVVGFTTVVNATIVQAASRERQGDVDVHAPVNIALTAAGVVVPVVGEMLDSSVGTQISNSEGQKSSFVAKGEYVCALQYREIKHRWLSSNIDNLRLSNTQWFSLDMRRDEEYGEDDVMDVQMEALEEHELEETFTKRESEDGSALILID
ncbi:hypothetical protein K4K54_009280 [Colletotrichum sp. SAR 10_86]|nr:hypothetical protein K4K54_009280 [Colletotrichum sp. SAR 10_86]KAJ5001029.1 hypothetical protein K4K48_001952 [Colletotrichum sp. SAR 10_66]